MNDFAEELPATEISEDPMVGYLALPRLDELLFKHKFISSPGVDYAHIMTENMPFANSQGWTAVSGLQHYVICGKPVMLFCEGVPLRTNGRDTATTISCFVDPELEKHIESYHAVDEDFIPEGPAQKYDTPVQGKDIVITSSGEGAFEATEPPPPPKRKPGRPRKNNPLTTEA